VGRFDLRQPNANFDEDTYSAGADGTVRRTIVDLVAEIHASISATIE